MWSEPRRRHVVLANSDAVVVTLPSGVALHARPAATFVKTAMGFRSRLTVGANGKKADCKSILAVLAMGATGGTTLTLQAEGEDAPAALDALAACVTSLTE